MQALYNLGFSLLEKKRLTEALPYFSEACRIAPKSGDSHNALGFVLFRLGRLREAKKHFETALKLNPQDSNARENLERALRKLNEAP